MQERPVYHCPKCKSCLLEVEASFLCEYDGQDNKCTYVDKHDYLSVDDCATAKCLNCGNIDYLYRWEVKNNEGAGT